MDASLAASAISPSAVVSASRPADCKPSASYVESPVTLPATRWRLGIVSWKTSQRSVIVVVELPEALGFGGVYIMSAEIVGTGESLF